MSEPLDDAAEAVGRKALLKHLILQLHGGTAPAEVQKQLVRVLGQVPYGLVVEVEQQLIAEGLPVEEVTRLCHLHGAALEGAIDASSTPEVPEGHPVHVFRLENAALVAELSGLQKAVEALGPSPRRSLSLLAPRRPAAADGQGEPGSPQTLADGLFAVRARLNALTDVEKHYLRKEHLLFPFLEKHGVTGPPKVMWAKHDETRALLRAALEALEALAAAPPEPAEARATVALAVGPVAQAVRDMVDREERILLPMSLDTLGELEWWEIARQSAEIGFCLIDPDERWRPASAPAADQRTAEAGRIRLRTGSFTVAELEAMLNALPVDVTFVDADDRVRFFSHGRDRVFSRSRAVIGRKVQFCHPPRSVGTVERILGGFRAGTHDRATFWIDLRGRFVHIDYVALRDADGAYLGCLEVTEDLTEKRQLQGQRRLLSWDRGDADA